ncbi:hypothetical protein VP1G_09752 [Cytospora mali]|uniref:Uncharacterized protein n=1 Tax=Cytospora mali TaxID=578113 RepID=A0A194VF44_CYTMA|nr:hypothetical protein VP1G_09752 [Valsa mali var. pyri (nom. inval.)]
MDAVPSPLGEDAWFHNVGSQPRARALTGKRWASWRSTTLASHSDPYGPSPNILGKRKASASPQICIQCKSAFSPGANYPEACTHHDGALLINDSDEVWADWDENISGPHNTDANRDEYPQGFTWSCCKRVGTKPGCTRGFHVAVRGENKRLRLPGPGQDPDVLRMFEGKVLRPNEFVNENLWDSWDDSEAWCWERRLEREMRPAIRPRDSQLLAWRERKSELALLRLGVERCLAIHWRIELAGGIKATVYLVVRRSS